MSIELIIELWSGIKDLIPEKDQIHVANTLVGMFDDYGYSDGIEHEVGLDPILSEAVASRFDLFEEEELDYDDDSDW